MCGICGIFDPFSTLSPAQRRAGITAMMNEFAYRGPDEKGTVFQDPEGLGFGHVRLSIIDLEGGQQPMASPDGQLQITFNGEIYNYREERQALEAQGVRFRTHSDTEVILALYARYGVEAWPRLRGQFAFGLWDARARQLFLVRDRLGEKPLLYSYHDRVLTFASELKTLLRAPGVPKTLDPSIPGLYLLLSHVPSPHTLIQGIHKLPPGCFLRVSAQGLEKKSYWAPDLETVIAAGPEEATIDHFRSLFQDAVRLCTVSDVPVGTFLSGGLDSTSVTWAAAQASPHPLHSFAIFNRENHEQHPDWAYAQEAAAYLKTNHHNVFYDLPELMKQIPELIDKTDEPFQGATGLVSLMLSKFTRQHVKVVLTGSGGDELLGGYQTYYQQVLRAQNVWQAVDRWLPGSIRQMLGAVLGPLHPLLARIGMPQEERRVVTNVDYHAPWLDRLRPGQRPVIRQKYIESLREHAVDHQKNYFKRFLWADLRVGHAHSITTLPDATGMACSLEARNPFLDYKLVEFLLRLDPQWLIRRTYQNKYLLVKAMVSRIPDSILYRSKMGFSGMTQEQIIRWMRTDGRALFHDHLLDSPLVKDGIFPKTGVESVWKDFSEAPNIPQANYYLHPIWAAGMLALWHERHIGSS